MDGYIGFFDILIHSVNQEEATLTCPCGTFVHRRLHFELCNTPVTFQHCMTGVFLDFIKSIVEVFMDDFSIYRGTFDLCIENLTKVLYKCEEVNLVLN